MILSLKNFLLLPEFFFCLSILYLFFYGTVLSTTLKTKKLIIKSIVNLSILILVFSIVLFWNNLNSVALQSSYFYNSIAIDYLSETTKILLSCFTLCCMYIFRKYLYIQKINHFEYIIVLLLAVLGVFLLCSSNDLLTAYLSIELQSLAFYILASFKKKSSFSVHAGLKYFILGAFASCLFLFSASLLYGLTGTINFENLFIFLHVGSLLGLNGCFAFFVQKLAYLPFFSFYYSFDTDFEDVFLELYLCLLESNCTHKDSLSLLNLENNLENLLIIFNKCIYYGDNSLFNFTSLLDLICHYIFFFFDHYYIEFDFYQFMFHYNTGFFEYLTSELVNIMDSFFLSALCSNFFFFDNLNNFFVFKLLELYCLIGISLKNINFIGVYCIDLFISDSLNFFTCLVNYFVLDMCFFYYRLYSLLPTIIVIGLSYFLLFSIFFKLAVIPFNFWLPDVYEGSLSSTTAFFAIIPKLSIFVFLFRLMNFEILVDTDTFSYNFLICGMASIFYGSVIAIEERKLKSLIAFSAISNVGFLFITFSVFSIYANALVFCYLLIYMLGNLIIWLFLLMFNIHSNSTDYKKFNKELSNFSNFYRSNKVMASFFSFALFSIAGIPPFIGFIAKFGVFVTVIESYLFLAAVFSILCSILSVFYYLRIIKLIFFEKSDELINLYEFQSSFFYFIFMIFVLLLVFLFINPNLIYLIFLKISYNFS